MKKLIWLLSLALLQGLWCGQNAFAATTLNATFAVTSNWGTGYNASITITNPSSTAMKAWSCTFTLPTNHKFTTGWNGKFTVSGTSISVANEDWNGTINPGQSVSIGFGVDKPQAATAKVNNLKASGTAASTSPPPPPPGTPPPPSSFPLGTSYVIDQDWGTGYQLTVKVTNSGTTKTTSWTSEFDVPAGQTLDSFWDGVKTVSGQHVTVANPAWVGGGEIMPGKSATFGMTIRNPQKTAKGVLNLKAYANGTAPAGTAPAAPVLSAINNADQDGAYKVAWQASATAENYSLQQDTSNAFGNPTAAFSGNALEKSFTGQANGTYYYRVRATNSYGDSGYSNIVSAVVNVPPPPPAPAAPVLLAIDNGDEDGNFTVQWGSVSGSDTYALEESATANFTAPQIIFQGAGISYGVQNKTSGTFYYRVSARNAGGSSPASNVQSATVSVATPPAAPRKVIGYYAGWSIYRTPSFKPESIAADKLTHINYAFVNHDTAGNLILVDPWGDIDYRNDWNSTKPYWGNFFQLKELKQRHPHLKILASVGGWTLSNNFSAMAASPAARTNFVSKCIQFCETYEFFDGIDIDWEYPGFAEHSGRPQDTQNFTLLLKEMSAAFKAHPRKYLLTIASPAGAFFAQNIELDKIHPYLDAINVMTYDFHGAWGGGDNAVTNHNAPLYPPLHGDPALNSDDTVKYYLSRGVPREKIVLGLPLYGRSYANARSTGDGLYSTYTGAGSGTTEEAGMVFFYDIKNNRLNTYTPYRDLNCRVPYLHNERSGTPNYLEYISYDDELSIGEKCAYAREEGLGGVMFWELGMDTWANGNWDLVSVIDREMKR